MSLPESLERAASELPELADKVRPANGDPHRLLQECAPEEASVLLSWVLDQAPADAPELVEAWGAAEQGVEVLLALSDDGIGKAGRKVLRTARHRLRSQGMRVESVSAVAPSQRSPRGADLDRWQAAHVSAPDFRGTRMGYLVDSHPSGGARLFEMRFDESRGLLDFKVYNAGRSKVRGFLKSLTERSGQQLFEVDRDALRALVWRASRAQPQDRPLPTAFVEWRSRLFSDDLEKEATPGDRARAACPAAELAGARVWLVERMRSGSLGPWPPATAWVGDWMDRGREAVEGLDAGAREVAIESWTESVVAALDEATDPVLIARHLDELAWVESEKGDMEAAGQLLAVSEVLGSDEGVRAELTRVRVESLFEPFLASLRVIEEPGLEA
jgi:hypothetical protein